MKQFCNDNNYSFVQHSALQTGDSSLYDDDVHINRSGGTSLFVGDIHKALGLYRRDNTGAQSQEGGDRVFFSRQPPNRGQSDGGHTVPAVWTPPPDGDGGPTSEQRQPTVKAPEAPHTNMSMTDIDNMLKLLTLNMLRSFNK